MPAVDPFSLIVTNNLLMVVVTVVLLVSRIGLGSAAKGARTWVLGDVLVAAGRTVFVLAVSAGGAHGSPWAILSGALAMSGLMAHWLAMRRATGHELAAPRAALAMLVPAATYALPAMLVGAGGRLLLLQLHLVAMALALAHATWPLRRSLGGRLIVAVMALAILYNTTGMLRLVHLGFELPHQANAEVLFAIWIELVIAMVLSMGFLIVLQERLRERIERLAVTDALTGAFNRHGLAPLLTRELAIADRRAEPLSVVLFDLDHFKRINDGHGHGAGDQVLAGFAARVRAGLRRGDLFARWGGEEFLLVLPNTALREAGEVANRIRKSIETATLAAGLPAVTVSGGAACISEPSLREMRDDAQRLPALLGKADQRLYVAKRTRNTVCAQADADVDQPAEPSRQQVTRAPAS